MQTGYMSIPSKNCERLFKMSSDILVELARAHSRGNGLIAVSTPQKDSIENVIFSLVLDRSRKNFEMSEKIKKIAGMSGDKADVITTNLYIWRGGYWQIINNDVLKSISSAVGANGVEPPTIDSLTLSSYIMAESNESPIKELSMSMRAFLRDSSQQQAPESGLINREALRPSLGNTQQSQQVKLVEQASDSYYIIPSIHEFERNPITSEYLEVFRRNVKKTNKIDSSIVFKNEDVKDRSFTSKSIIFLLAPSESLPAEVAAVTEVIMDGVPAESDRVTYIKKMVAKNVAIYKKAAQNNANASNPKVVFVLKNLNDQSSVDSFCESLSKAASGLTYYDIDNIFASIMQDIAADGVKYGVKTSDDFVSAALEEKVKLINNCQALEYMRPVSMDSVGGLDKLKEFIQTRKVAFTKQAEDFGISRPKGIFMSGIPGTGKSLTARACGSVLGWPVIRLSLSDLYGGLVGSTEKNTRETLDILKKLAPAVVLVDEIDKHVNVNSGSGDSGTSQRLLGNLLTFMQECQEPLFWMMSANRIDNLPSELLRKGRLDECFGLDFPTYAERKQVLSIHLKKRGKRLDELVSADVERLVESLDHYVPAEIESIVNEAVLARFIKHTTLGESTILEYDDFAQVISETKRIADINPQQVLAIQEWVRTSARAASSKHEVQLTKPKKKSSKVLWEDN